MSFTSGTGKLNGLRLVSSKTRGKLLCPQVAYLGGDLRTHQCGSGKETKAV